MKEILKDILKAIFLHPKTSLAGFLIFIVVMSRLFGKIDDATATSAIGIMSAVGLFAAKDWNK